MKAWLGPRWHSDYVRIDSICKFTDVVEPSVDFQRKGKVPLISAEASALAKCSKAPHLMHSLFHSIAIHSRELES